MFGPLVPHHANGDPPQFGIDDFEESGDGVVRPFAAVLQQQRNGSGSCLRHGVHSTSAAESGSGRRYLQNSSKFLAQHGSDSRYSIQMPRTLRFTLSTILLALAPVGLHAATPTAISLSATPATATYGQ